MDHDTLMQVYTRITTSSRAVDRIEHLLGQLIRQRNPDPRIDQMILIFAARLMGQSTAVIPDAGVLFESILRQEERLNEWVIAFVAEAIADYPHDLADGDRLVDLMQERLTRIRSRDRSEEEYFGFHFLPPPKSHQIRTYLAGIPERRRREMERIRYYMLVQAGIAEADILGAFTYLKTHGAPDDGRPCPDLMQCLLRYQAQLLPRKS